MKNRWSPAILASGVLMHAFSLSVPAQAPEVRVGPGSLTIDAPALRTRTAAVTNVEVAATNVYSREQLETMLQTVEADLAAVGKEEQDMRNKMMARRESFTNIVSNVATQNPEIAVLQKKLADLEQETRATRMELQKKLMATPAFQQVDNEMRGYGETMVKLRERRSALMAERNRISAQIWRLRRMEEEKSRIGSETNAPVAPAPQP